MISCILLSAGLSSRFGSPKALAKLNSKTTIEHLTATLLASKVDEIIVVLGDMAETIKPIIPKHSKIKIVFNELFREGQTSSFKAGLRTVSPKAKGMMLSPVDTPLVTAKTLNMLIEEFYLKEPAILIPAFETRRGHPPIFHVQLKEQLLNLSSSKGLNEFEREHSAEACFFPVSDPGILINFNTPEEFTPLKHVYLKTIASAT